MFRKIPNYCNIRKVQQQQKQQQQFNSCCIYGRKQNIGVIEACGEKPDGMKVKIIVAG